MKYKSLIERCLKEARAEVLGLKERGVALGRGAFGDRTYRIDRVSELAILKVLEEELPDASVVSEELGTVEKGEVTVLIDPIDGSVNSIRGVPIYSIAIAVAEGRRFGDVVSSGVMDVVHGDIFMAGRGEGAYLNGRRIRVSERGLEDGLIFVNPSLKPGDARMLAPLLERARHPRSLGSAALETAYVAAGIGDAYVSPAPRLRPFDCLPSLLLVIEAGGYVKTLNFRLEDIPLSTKMGIAYIAANGKALAEEISALVGGSG
ncbi:MAG: inositol monophosphatase [Thaumarchaeota archaeon]|nr:inositol monophosphatase [Nitrososphaerota archaeon]